ncbi:MAG: DUF2264 C-terminal domain-containing protein, partial [Dermatophilaceae bacterium]
EAKYAKFAYSTAFGFSVATGSLGVGQVAPDSMLALSDDTGGSASHFRVREAAEECSAREGMVHSRWSPWPDVHIDTWLWAVLPWHLRLHRVRSDRQLTGVEGGWAIARPSDLAAATTRAGAAGVVCGAGQSAVLDLTVDPAAGRRTGRVELLSPGANLMTSRACLPTLVGHLEPGEHWLGCAVLGVSDPAIVRPGWADEGPALEAALRSVAASVTTGRTASIRSAASTAGRPADPIPVAGVQPAAKDLP